MINLRMKAMSDRVMSGIGNYINGRLERDDFVDLFESMLGDYFGSSGWSAVSSSTSALHLAIYMAEIPQGSYALCSPFAGIRLLSALRSNGIQPSWVDIDPFSLNMDLASIRERLHPEIRLIVITHLAGYPVDTDEIKGIQDHYERTYKKKLCIIEDCSSAWGSRFCDRIVGTGDYSSVFSFDDYSPLCCEKGACLHYPSSDDNERVKKLRCYGTGCLPENGDAKEIGFGFEMSMMNAIIGISNFEFSLRAIQTQRNNAAFYDSQLRNLNGIRLTRRHHAFDSSFSVYPIMVSQRNDFVKAMKSRGVECESVFSRLDQLSCVSHYKRKMDRLDSIYPSLACLPNGFWVDSNRLDYIMKQIRLGW